MPLVIIEQNKNIIITSLQINSDKIEFINICMFQNKYRRGNIKKGIETNTSNQLEFKDKSFIS